jgi:Fe-S cluster biogenesis protein NfuA
VTDAALRARIEGVLAELRPFFQSDGGDVEFVEMTAAGVVRVRLMGACHNCPSSTQTMQNGIKVALQEVMPEVTAVEGI